MTFVTFIVIIIVDYYREDCFGEESMLRGLSNRCIIFALCIYMMRYFENDATLVTVAVFTSIALTCLCEALSKKKFSTFVSVAAIVFEIVSQGIFAVMLPMLTVVLASEFACRDNRMKLKYINFQLLYPLAYMLLSSYVMYLAGIDPLLAFAVSVLALHLGVSEVISRDVERALESEEDRERGMEILMRQHREDSKVKQDAEVREATLRERNRIAREIHDNVGHSLSRALLMVGAINAVNRDENLKEPIDNLKETLSEAMTNIRTSVHDLYDESIDLERSLTALVEGFTFCPVRLDVEVGDHMGKNTKYCILSIVKEALSNTANHSNATHVNVTVRSHEKIYQLLIEDNGTKSFHGDGTGIGIDNMRDRVTALKGTIYCSNDNGFRIFATIPRETG